MADFHAVSQWDGGGGGAPACECVYFVRRQCSIQTHMFVTVQKLQ